MLDKVKSLARDMALIVGFALAVSGLIGVYWFMIWYGITYGY